MSSVAALGRLSALLALVSADFDAPRADGGHCEVAATVATHFVNHPTFYLLPDLYGSALDFKSLFEAHERFANCSSWPSEKLQKRLDELLDDYEHVPFTSAWIAKHNRSVTSFPDAIGDTRGLFPVVYLERAEVYRRHPELAPGGYVRASDMEIAAAGARAFILPFPGKLLDGSLARRSGGKAWKKAADASYLWADDQFMGLALVTRLAEATLDAEWLEQLSWAVQQLELFESHLRDPANGLYAHGYSDERKERSCCKWGRANGWGLLARAEVLRALETAAAAGHHVAGRNTTLKAFRAHATAFARVQSADGRWHQVLDVNSTYLETSATAMATYAFARGVARGWLPTEPFADAATRGWAALTSQVGTDGKVKGICIPTNVLESAAAYDRRPTWPFLSVEGGVGAILRAAVAMRELEEASRAVVV